MDQNNQRQEDLRVLIEAGIAGIEAGRVTEYESAEDLFKSIVEEGGRGVLEIFYPSYKNYANSSE